MSREWHYQPEVPIPLSPIFSWPPRPVAAFRWLASSWLAVSAIVLFVLLAVLVWNVFQPDAAEMRTVSPGWVAQIYMRNLILMCLVAGGLHLLFYTLRQQGDTLRYDTRDFKTDSRAFTFGNQVHDNMLWTLASGVTVWTAYEAGYFWAAANGIVPRVTVGEAAVWFVIWLILIPIWSSLHFYWVHLLLHWPPLYRRVHALHHRNVTVGPWSGISMHPVEHVVYFSSLLIHLVVPSHPVHVMFHCYLQGLGPAFSHSGFDAVLAGNRRVMDAGTFFHQLHHRYFECNYGAVDVPWDKWFGTFHDGTAEARTRIHRRLAARRAAAD